MEELRALYSQLPHLSKIPFCRILQTSYLITPLRRTLDAQKKAVAEFRLTSPKGAKRWRGSRFSALGSLERGVTTFGCATRGGWHGRRASDEIRAPRLRRHVALGVHARPAEPQRQPGSLPRRRGDEHRHRHRARPALPVHARGEQGRDRLLPRWRRHRHHGLDVVPPPRQGLAVTAHGALACASCREATALAAHVVGAKKGGLLPILAYLRVSGGRIMASDLSQQIDIPLELPPACATPTSASTPAASCAC
jgi:hypothetical protein